MSFINKTVSGLSENRVIGSAGFAYDPGQGLSGVFRQVQVQDFVGASLQNSTSNSTPSGNSWGIAIYPNANRKRAIITNLGSGAPIFVKLGSAVFSNNFHFILSPGRSVNDGSGQSISLDYWSGAIALTGVDTVKHDWIAFEIN